MVSSTLSDLRNDYYGGGSAAEYAFLQGMQSAKKSVVHSLDLANRGMYHKIAEITLDAVAASIDFQNIPQTFKHLYLEGTLRSALGAATFDSINVSYNGDVTDADYAYIFSQGLGVTQATAESIGSAGARIALTSTAALSNAADHCGFEMILPNYRSDKSKQIIMHVGGALLRTTLNSFERTTVHHWRKAPEAINRITLTSFNGVNLAAGSTVSLYGYKDATPLVKSLVRYVADGQSLTNTPYSGMPWPAAFVQHRPEAECMRVGISGTTYAQRDVTVATRVDPLIAVADRLTVLLIDGGQSDIINGATSAGLIATMAAYCAARRVAGVDKIFAPTMPKSSFFDAGMEAHRVAYNAAIKADPLSAGLDGVVDILTLPEIQDNLNLTYFYDGTHYTLLACSIIGEYWANHPLIAGLVIA